MGKHGGPQGPKGRQGRTILGPQEVVGHGQHGVQGAQQPGSRRGQDVQPGSGQGPSRGEAEHLQLQRPPHAPPQPQRPPVSQLGHTYSSTPN